MTRKMRRKEKAVQNLKKCCLECMISRVSEQLSSDE